MYYIILLYNYFSCDLFISLSCSVCWRLYRPVVRCPLSGLWKLAAVSTEKNKKQIFRIEWTKTQAPLLTTIIICCFSSPRGDCSFSCRWSGQRFHQRNPSGGACCSWEGASLLEDQLTDERWTWYAYKSHLPFKQIFLKGVSPLFTRIGIYRTIRMNNFDACISVNE